MPSSSKHLAEASSALDDSSYEILSDSVYLGSDDDDEGNTISVASTTDGHTTDELSSIADTEESDDEQQQSDSLIGSQHISTRDNDNNEEQGPGTDSNMTTIPIKFGPSPAESKLRESFPKEIFSRLRWPLISYDSQHLPSGLSDVGCLRGGNVTLYLNLSTATDDECFQPDHGRALRIWYFGNKEEQDIIMKKIDDSLKTVVKRSAFQSASAIPSWLRFTNPKYHHLNVDACTSLKYESGGSNSVNGYGFSTISASMSNHSDSIIFNSFGSEMTGIPDYKLPDLVVFCYPENGKPRDTDLDISAMQNIRNIFYDKMIPTLEMCKSWDFTKSRTTKQSRPGRESHSVPRCMEEYPNYNKFHRQALYVSIEVANPPMTYEEFVKDTLPVSLTHFLRLNQKIIGSHIKCITEGWSWHSAGLVSTESVPYEWPPDHSCKHNQRRQVAQGSDDTNSEEQLKKRSRNWLNVRTAWSKNITPLKRSSVAGFLTVTLCILSIFVGSYCYQGQVMYGLDCLRNKGFHNRSASTVTSESVQSQNGYQPSLTWSNLFGIKSYEHSPTHSPTPSPEPSESQSIAVWENLMWTSTKDTHKQGRQGLSGHEPRKPNNNGRKTPDKDSSSLSKVSDGMTDMIKHMKNKKFYEKAKKTDDEPVKEETAQLSWIDDLRRNFVSLKDGNGSIKHIARSVINATTSSSATGLQVLQSLLEQAKDIDLSEIILSEDCYNEKGMNLVKCEVPYRLRRARRNGKALVRKVGVGALEAAAWFRGI
jgi:hypothetical protein